MADQRGPVGLITGGGALPLEIARVILARGRGVFLVGLEGEAGPEIEAFPHAWANWGQIGKLLGSLEHAGCRDVALVGRVRRPDLKRLRLDLGFFRAVPTLLRIMAGGDDSILRRIVRFFEVHGFEVRGLAELAPELLAGCGRLGRLQPYGGCERDLVVGLGVLSALSPFDIGQAIVVDGGAVVAIEAAEGTDGMLRRLAESRRKVPSGGGRGGVLVKAPKAGQEMRIDIPVIGPETVTRAVAAGVGGIAVSAGHVLITSQHETIAAADSAELFLVGFDRAGPARIPETPRAPAALWAASRRRPSRQETTDIHKGRAVLDALAGAPGATATGVIVARDYVLGVDAGEGLVELCNRARDLRQWGDGTTKRRRGALIARSAGANPEAVVRAAVAAGLAAIAIPDARAASELARVCDRDGLTVVAYPGGSEG